jgi:hypothetical protein
MERIAIQIAHLYPGTSPFLTPDACKLYRLLEET